MERVRPGQRIKARHHNEGVEASERIRRSIGVLPIRVSETAGSLQVSSSKRDNLRMPANYIIALNLSETDLEIYDSVMIVDMPYATHDDFIDKHHVQIRLPEAGDLGPLAIVMEPISANGAGLICTDGIAVCRVTQHYDFAFRTADFAVGETHLRAQPDGPIEILWEEEVHYVDEPHWAVVRLNTRDMSKFFRFKNVTGGTIAANALMTPSSATGWVLDDGEYYLSLKQADSDQDEPAYVNYGWTAIPAGGFGVARLARGSFLALSDSVVAGTEVGIASGAWSMSTSKYGYRVIADFGVAGIAVLTDTPGGTSGGGGGGTTPGDTIPIIWDAAGEVGGSDTHHRRDDTRPGLKIYATKPGMAFVGAAGGLGVIWGVYGNVQDVTGDVNAIGNTGTLAHTNHHHHLDVSLDFSWNVGTLRIEWGQLPIDNDTIKRDGGGDLYVSRILVDGDFSMANDANLAHAFNANEPFYSTATGLGLSLGDGVELTGAGGPKDLIAHIDDDTILFDVTGAMYVDSSALGANPPLSDAAAAAIDASASSAGVSGNASRYDHRHGLTAGNGLAWSGGVNLIVDLKTNGGLAFDSGQLEWLPYRVSQAAQPTPGVGRAMMWRDSDDSKTYLVYNDTDEGVRAVELT